MTWITPLFLALLYWIIAPIWYFLSGRWKADDWKEMCFGFCVLVVFSYLIFFGLIGINYLHLPFSTLGGVIIGIIFAAGYVSLLTRFRRRVNQDRMLKTMAPK